MLLLIFASLWVLVLEDEMNLPLLVQSLGSRQPTYLIRRATFIWTKHDHVR